MVPMVASILLLPSELKYLIAELCSESSDSLAALARTHTTYQKEAEKALYHTVSISASCDDSLKCMDTLATNSEKAALVRFLTIEYARNNIDKNQRVMTYLLKSLINMHSLSDFRVYSQVEIHMKGLGNILCQGHFRLQTFYCEDVLNISQIIKSQTELQILGLFYPRCRRNILKTLKELHNAQLFLPIVFTLEREGGVISIDHIGIFPMFYSVDRRTTIPRVLAESFCKDQGSCMLSRADSIRELSIYLNDSSDLPSIYALAKDMAVSFSRIGWLNLYFERRCEIPPQEIEEEFSFFSNLYVVNTYVWPTSCRSKYFCRRGTAHAEWEVQ